MTRLAGSFSQQSLLQSGAQRSFQHTALLASFTENKYLQPIHVKTVHAEKNQAVPTGLHSTTGVSTKVTQTGLSWRPATPLAFIRSVFGCRKRQIISGERHPCFLFSSWLRNLIWLLIREVHQSILFKTLA